LKEEFKEERKKFAELAKIKLGGEADWWNGRYQQCGQ
jgi:hypothetical protein